MARRFYQAKLDEDRPLFFEDFGGLLKMSGVLFQGQGKNLLLLLPTHSPVHGELDIAEPTLKGWAAILAETDDPKVLEMDQDGVNVKAIHRKVKYGAISGAVQQKVWAQDGFKCMFCNLPMGKVQMTVDHWVPLEQGGANDTSNYISACRRCNKQKGSIHPIDFCKKHGYNFDALNALVKARVVK